MAKSTPQVVDGLRNPLDKTGADPERAAVDSKIQDIKAAQAALAVPKASPDEVVYQSQYASYRVQVMSPFDEINPITGQRTPRKGKVAQFRDFEFRTRDKQIIEALERNKHYGLGRDFWRADEGRAAHLQATTESLVATIRTAANPEIARRLIAELAPLAGPDFQLPPPPQASSAEGESAKQ